ncbi:hypothetical protein M427DRAFT_153986 [Gonapodya prolifera JEL478]|uniref:Tetraspannin-domain-containing protein n=1 Tax=Gonapodya prolifera (strain JEL478) TaxID=1344416 RepID=A0A139AK66_GONPJ|nr:hypothetical protein M427DRAFT_153986 [Gonapodya prolifera JEL478]|eukprot:KXS17170.1 hypothetical protein M427DRAFT_153986 [Gonapodya prolifera JEL478]
MMPKYTLTYTHPVHYWLTILSTGLIVLSGLALSILGTYLAFWSGGGPFVTKEGPITLMIMGGVLALVGLMGVFATGGESRKGLAIVAQILLLFFAIQIVTGSLTLSSKSAVESTLEASWDFAYKHSPRVIRDVQDEYLCCGFKNVTDRSYPKTSPDACALDPTNGYTQSCYAFIRKDVMASRGIVGWTVLGFAGLEALTVGFLVSLAFRIPTDEERKSDLLEEHRRLLGEVRGEGGSAVGGTASDSGYGGAGGHGATGGEAERGKGRGPWSTVQ